MQVVVAEFLTRILPEDVSYAEPYVSTQGSPRLWLETTRKGDERKLTVLGRAHEAASHV